MEMSSDSKDVKLRSQNKQPTCKYEKARRDRLNLFITELSTFLPEQNPTKSLSKIDVLEKIVQLIKQLLDEKEKLANKNCVDECLKEELKELKTTVSNLKARIVTLNKILKEAHLSVPLDLEVQHFDKNFTPHLRYSHRKRALTCQSTQTEQVDNESQGKSNQPHKEAHKKENEEESVGKLISFTKKLKPPLQEIQDNFSRQNEKAVRVGAVACHVVPPQILVVPLYPATRPAFTQLTFSNKRPISSYTHFKKIYTHQQEKLVKKARRKRQSRLRKKCSCQTVVLKKPDGTLKKIIKLCGYKSCKNKTKFRKIHEAAKQQLSEQAKAEKVKEISKVPAVDEHRVEMTRQEKNETEQPVPDSQQTMGVYSEQDLLQNLDTRDTGDTKLYESKETCSNNNTNKFEKENEYGPENTNYDFSNPTPSVSKKEKNTEDCYYPCTNYFSPMNSSSNYAVHTSGLNYESIKEDTKMRNQIHHSNMNSKSHNGSNTALEEKNPSNPHNNLILSVESNINQKDSHLTENINCNKNRNPDSLNLNNVNVVTHNIDDLNQKPSIETCVTPVLETYTSGNKLKQTKTPVEHVGSGSNARYVPSKSDGINGNNSMNNTSNDVSSQVNNVNGNNMSSNSALGSYSINSVIFSSKSCTNETIYQMPNCTSKHINSDMSYKGSNIMFHDQREKANQKIMETNNKTNNVSLSKQIVRKNLNFSFENLGSNVMSSEPSVEFGYNVSSDTGSIHPLLDSNYNTAEPHQLAFSCKNNTLFVGDTSYVESSEGKSSCYFESHPNALHFPYVSTNDKAALSSATKYCEENKRKVNLKQRQDIINNSSHDISQNIFEVNNKENSFDFLFGKQNSLNTPQKSKRKSDSCLMSDKAFLFEEMKFHSEFSNDLFSLPGQVGGQNLECVSPTAAFLLTFPVVSSKQTDLTDNIEPSNTITPIGNMESLSQDLPDLNFKSNIKGLFDPFYPSCLGTDKLNFDLNAMDHVREDHLLNKANFPSCSEVNNVVNNTPWSTNIISNDDSLKKKKFWGVY